MLPLIAGLLTIACVQGLPLKHTPASCQISMPDYLLSWKYDRVSSDVVFRLEAHSKFSNFWTAVYFGDKQPEDAIGVFLRAGQVGVLDGHISSGSNQVVADAVTNVQSLAFEFEKAEGRLVAEFARPLTPSDPEDKALRGCVTFYYPSTAVEIPSTGPIDMPTELLSQRVCDIATTCGDHASEVKKRADEMEPVCSYVSENGKNKLEWQPKHDMVLFTLTLNANKKGKWWTAIAFGQDMTNLPMIMTFTENGKVKNVGGYMANGYEVPAKSKEISAQIEKISEESVNGETTIQIAASPNLLENKDEEGCVHLQLSFLAGGYDAKFNPKKHDDKPIPVKVCNVNKCGAVVPVDASGDTVVEASGTEASGVAAATSSGEKPAEVVETSGEEGVAHASQEVIAPEGSGAVPENRLPGGENNGEASGVAPTSTETSGVEASGETPKVESSGVEASGVAPVAENVDKSTQGSGVDAKTDASGEQPKEASGEAPKSAEASGEAPKSAEASGEAPKSAEASGEAPKSAEASGDASKSAETSGEAPKNEASGASAEQSGEAPKVADASGEVPVQVESSGQQPTSAEASGVNVEASGESHKIEASGEAPKASGEVPEGSGQVANQQEASGQIVEASGQKAEGSGVAAEGSGHEASGVAPEGSGAAQEDVQTTKTVVDGETEKKSTPAVELPGTEAPVARCGADHQDLKVCEGYFAEYLGKVDDWAARHKQTVGEQMWKACALLKNVQHVPTMCCHIFTTTCSSYLHL